eukprot:m.39361 g.39361  ORF g.39361 m.39361 type:complete len:58 (+) comp14706_c0_seq8:261-434(+)
MHMGEGRCSKTSWLDVSEGVRCRYAHTWNSVFSSAFALLPFRRLQSTIALGQRMSQH